MEGNFFLQAITPCSINELRSIKADIIINGVKYMAAGDRGNMLHTFRWDDEKKAYFPVNAFHAHGGAVSAITYLEPCDWVPEGALFTSSQAKTICAWDNSIFTTQVSEPSPTITLIGHENNVCFLTTTENHEIISSSWDGTARVWSNGTEILKMSQKDGVWGVVPVPIGYVVLGADKSIRIYNKQGAQVSVTTDAHTDVVRAGLYIKDVATLVTTSNDGTIREWFIEEDGRLTNLEIIAVTDTYLYTLTLVGKSYVVGCEDKCAYIVSSDTKTVSDVIPVPGVAWCVSPAPNGVAITATDGVIYTFTQDKNYRADKDTEEAYINKVAGLTFNNPQIDQYVLEELPPYSEVNSREVVPGRFELMRDGEEKILVVYNQTYGWMKVGTYSKSKGAQAQKYTGPDGKQYDYCFTIDVEDLGGQYPLYMNYNTNPYTAASNFIREHNLRTFYMDQIANFIIRNLKGTNLQMQSSSERAPEPEPEPPKSSMFPSEPNYISGGNPEVIVNKLAQIAEKSNLEFSPEDKAILSSPLSDNWAASASSILLIWDVGDAWPLLDMFRELILHSDSRKYLQDDFVATIVDRFASAGNDLTDYGVMGLMRIISNLQKNYASCALNKMKILHIFDGFVERLKSLPKISQIPFANAMMNYSLYGLAKPDDQKSFVLTLQKALEFSQLIDDETLYRLLMAVGNTAAKYPQTRQLFLNRPELLETEGKSERCSTLISEIVKILQ